MTDIGVRDKDKDMNRGQCANLLDSSGKDVLKLFPVHCLSFFHGNT